MDPRRYGDMQAFIQSLKDEGLRAWSFGYSSGKFMVCAKSLAHVRIQTPSREEVSANASVKCRTSYVTSIKRECLKKSLGRIKSIVRKHNALRCDAICQKITSRKNRILDKMRQSVFCVDKSGNILFSLTVRRS